MSEHGAQSQPGVTTRWVESATIQPFQFDGPKIVTVGVPTAAAMCGGALSTPR